MKKQLASTSPHKSVLLLIVILYLILGFAYSSLNPILESPDELLNYENIRFIAEQQRLPVLQPGEFSKAHHPPLYYVLGAVLTGWVTNEQLHELAANTNPFWGYRTYESGADNKSQYLHDAALEGLPFRDAVLGIRLMRWLSLLLGAGVVVTIYASTRELIPAEPDLAWGAAALVAFNPMFLFIQSSVHNDALTNILAALTVFGVLRYWQHGPALGRVAFIAVFAALGILTKITFLFLGPFILLALVLRCWQDRTSTPDWWRTALKMLAVGAGLVLLIAGWWFVRNQMLYGEPTSMQIQASIWQPRENAPDWSAAIGELGFLRDSFWGVFGFGQILLHKPVYLLLALFDLAAAVGLILWALRARRLGGIYRAQGLLVVVLLLAPLTAFAATFGRMAVSGSADFGRYLFTTYAVLAPLAILGLTEWLPLVRRVHWQRPFLFTLASIFLLLAIYALLSVLKPAYAPPPIHTDVAEIEDMTAVNVSYPGLADLIGYRLQPETAASTGSVQAVEKVDVTLYWQVTGTTDKDYPLFVQLVTTDGERVAGRDTHPGLGNYPTSQWQPGEIIEDRVPVYIPAAVQEPTGVYVNIGLRDETGDYLSTDAGFDTVTLDMLRLAAENDVEPVGQPVFYELGGVVDLMGVEWAGDTAAATNSVQAAAGTTIPFTLTWQAQQTPETDYVVFVHLLNSAGELEATADGPPANGSFPTHLWQPGDTVIDQRLLELPLELTHGTYQVLVGWYRLDDLSRLPVFDENGEVVMDAAMPIMTLEIE